MTEVETRKDHAKWITKGNLNIEPKYLGDKYKLLKELNFSKKDLKVASSVVRMQEKMEKQLVTQFEKFLMFFNIEADIELHNGKMLVKISEIIDNAYIVNGATFQSQLDKSERRIFSRIIVNNLIIAHERS